jgi:hypothetical protein
MTTSDEQQYNIIMSQNENIKNTIEQLASQLQKYEQQSNYQNVYNYNIGEYNYYLFVFYYILVFCLIVLFLLKGSSYSISVRIVLILGFFFFPYIIQAIEYVIIETIKFSFAVVTVNPYQRNTNRPYIGTEILPFY